MTKKPHPIDVHVGAQIRSKRKSLDLSQTQLGNAIGVTFQQVQKYERGTNRIGASRLAIIADFLGVSLASLFYGAPGCKQGPDKEDMELETLVALRRMGPDKCRAIMTLAA